MPVIRLLDLPHLEARALLRDGAPVYLPVNPVEYHGPHLSLHNDRLITHAQIAALGERLLRRHGWPTLLADDLEIGVDPCPGPGTRKTPYSVARRLVVEACRALAELGAQRVVLMTFHGSPLHAAALEAGRRWLERAGVRVVAPFNRVTGDLLGFDRERCRPMVAHLAPDVADAVLAGLQTDFHGGFFETSVALHHAPHAVSPHLTTLPACPIVRPDPALAMAARFFAAIGATRLAAELTFAAVGAGWYALRPFPGYTGQPAHATAAAGALFAEEMLDSYEELVDAVLHGREASPEPILAWLPTVTLGGRIGDVTRGVTLTPPPPAAASTATRSPR